MKTLFLVCIILWTQSSKASDSSWFGPEANSEKYYMVASAIDDAHKHDPEIPKSGLLMMSEKYTEILIKMTFPKCGPDRYCPAAIPSPMYVKLPVTFYMETSCGIITIADRDSRASGGTYQRIKVVDYRNALCKIFVDNLLHAEYSTTGINPEDGEDFTYVSSFEFSTKF